jgi:uncharacterized protein YraI
MKSKLATVLVAAALVGSAGGASAFPRVVTDLAAFRSGPGVTFMPILAIPPATVVNVRGCFHGWCRVNYAGNSGFVAHSLLARPAIIAPVVAAPVAVVAPVAAPVVTVKPAIVAPAPAPLLPILF